MNDAVALAYLHEDQIAHSFHRSLLELIGHDLAHHGRVIKGGWYPYRCGTGGIVQARNLAVAEFLTGEKQVGGEEHPDWWFWVDTDMGYTPDTVDRLLEVADPELRPIVGGLCFAQLEFQVDGLGGFKTAARPTILDWRTIDGRRKVIGRAHFPVNALVQCAATGSACILIHRSVFEKIYEAHGPVWYDRIPGDDGLPLGEDVSFCLRAASVGCPTFVHTGVKTSHLKPVWLSDREFWEQQVAPPADERVTVIVPVLGRPQNAELFMRSLRASTGMADVSVAFNPNADEEMKAWAACGSVHATVKQGVTTFAQKVNHAMEYVDTPWIFIVGDDVRFHPGWLDHALYVAKLYKASVVGTNDLGNPRVLAGEHATHLLISTDYIREQGASWDGPGTVCHEGYRHWYVDDEIVTVAKQRGVWAFAQASIVEHLHPAWGKAEHDEVYELGQASAEEDGRLFRGRVKAYT